LLFLDSETRSSNSCHDDDDADDADHATNTKANRRVHHCSRYRDRINNLTSYLGGSLARKTKAIGVQLRILGSNPSRRNPFVLFLFS
jgi:hypothetical protein